MKRSCIFVFFVFLMISEYGVAQSSWTAVDDVDAFTDKEFKAVVYEDDTHRIQISIETENSIAMYLVLKRGTFEPNTTLELRVDSNPMTEFKPMSDMVNEVTTDIFGMRPYQWTPSTLVILFASIEGLSSTKPEDIESGSNSCKGIMVQFLNGESLIGRYHVSDTGRETFSVSLEGFKGAANQVFDIADVNNDNPNCVR